MDRRTRLLAVAAVVISGLIGYIAGKRASVITGSVVVGAGDPSVLNSAEASPAKLPPITPGNFHAEDPRGTYDRHCYAVMHTIN